MGKEGLIVAVEPMRENYKFIQKLLIENDWKNVKLFRGAVSDECGEIKIHVGTNTINHSLVKDWKQGGGKGRGFKIMKENRIAIVGPKSAEFKNIMIPPKRSVKVKMTFKRLSKTPKRTFYVDIVQLSPVEKGVPKLVGGITYEIRTK